jgi:hypothetical protein
MAKKKSPAIPPTSFPDAQILWECEFLDKPDLLESLIRERIGHKAAMDLMGERIKKINTSIMEFFKRNRIKSTEYGGFSVYLSAGKKTTLSVKALVEAGVSIEIIKQCAKSTPWETLGVRRQGEKPGEGEGEETDV